MIKKYNGFIFDLDGTIYRGSKIIDYADKVVNELKKQNKKILFISNKTTGSKDQYYDFLKTNGLEVEKNEIITSTVVIRQYLIKNHKDDKFFAIGEKNFIDELTNGGLLYSADPDEIDIVIITLDRTLSYTKLEIAAKALEKGAKFFAANIDDTCPVESGEIMDAGSIITALEKRTRVKLEKHFGKPSEYMMNEVKKNIGIDISECLIIGDRLETDIALGNIFGVDTALVSTGVTNFINGKYKPTYQINSVYNLITEELE